MFCRRSDSDNTAACCGGHRQRNRRRRIKYAPTDCIVMSSAFAVNNNHEVAMLRPDSSCQEGTTRYQISYCRRRSQYRPVRISTSVGWLHEKHNSGHHNRPLRAGYEGRQQGLGEGRGRTGQGGWGTGHEGMGSCRNMIYQVTHTNISVPCEFSCRRV